MRLLLSEVVCIGRTWTGGACTVGAIGEGGISRICPRTKGRTTSCLMPRVAGTRRT